MPCLLFCNLFFPCTQPSGLSDVGRQEPCETWHELGPGWTPAWPPHGEGIRRPWAVGGKPSHVEGRLKKHSLVYQEARSAWHFLEVRKPQWCTSKIFFSVLASNLLLFTLFSLGSSHTIRFVHPVRWNLMEISCWKLILFWNESVTLPA